MNIPMPQVKPITQDNTKLQSEVIGLFKSGDLKWNTGGTIQEKKDGLNCVLQGLRKLQLWIEREYDVEKKKSLQNQYDARREETCKRLETLEKYEKGEIVQDTSGNGGSNQQQQKKQGEKDTKSELSNALSDAIVKDKPNVKWTDIAGLEAAKSALQEAVLLPIKFPDFFEGARTPWKGILMYGPPGTGKTYLAKACATEAEGTFFSVSSADLISKYVGESEKLIKTLFTMAREQKPSIIFIDEIDSMCGARGEGQNDASRRVITEFLVQMQGVGHDDKGVLVLGATNLPWALDTAIRRRFEKRIYIPLPDVQAREYMIQNSLKQTKTTLTKEQFEDLAVKTEGYSGSDISVLVRDAVYEPVRKLQSAKKFKQIPVNGQLKWTPVAENEDGTPKTFMELSQGDIAIPDVCYNDFLLALKKSKKSVSQDQLGDFEKWTKEFGQEG
ncbi:unnamed protein product (macronuclear) [Paramecium tetraurelia]|uniref:AAA+ ATPase domain-containing protein n=1 Tax=Paramecium tetraurelia TaxID=5888 RepID=A0CBD0_PARTE|nr:uncharacterized protein GSPATT00036880001 [Paramecium tetraurelia]CAK68097.1 unnamed protein product [Paramecium tetraurelia]|eukprot:XP_001435494.1 hypothetical protein (macronuclear) [Paramecium tetraurelia strain d4-2]